MKKFLTSFVVFCFVYHLMGQGTLALTFNGSPPFSAGETFTVTGTITGANTNAKFRVEVVCPSCQVTNTLTCDINLTNVQTSGSCTTTNFTAPTGTFYGFQVNGTCILPNGSYDNCTATSVLPVELGSFSATYNNNQVELKWQTLSEVNNDRFEVEHSRDGYHFQSVGTIEGSGTITEAKNYFYFHRTSVNGTHYYRLKQVDTDGTFDYSNVVGVIVDNGGQLSIYPNPAKDVIYVQQDELDGISNFQLMDAMGRKLNTSMNGNAGLYEISLPAGLPKGTYWLKVERGGQVQTLPVVKE